MIEKIVLVLGNTLIWMVKKQYLQKRKEGKEEMDVSVLRLWCVKTCSKYAKNPQRFLHFWKQMIKVIREYPTKYRLGVY